MSIHGVVLIGRTHLGTWLVVSNPVLKPGHSEFYAAKILENTVVPYVEYANTGVIYRVIRKRDVTKYVEDSSK